MKTDTHTSASQGTTPICGTDYCEACGDCLVCCAEDRCYGSADGLHVPSERMREARRTAPQGTAPDAVEQLLADIRAEARVLAAAALAWLEEIAAQGAAEARS